ncbi:TPA: phosphomethylpyrimidine synthase [bacterium]|nr:phosphomethylpyrimidine synthase [bacterium]
MTQVLSTMSDEIKEIATIEGVSEEFIRNGIASGTIVIPKNKKHKIEKPCAIGEGLLKKINANIGASTSISSLEFELKKLHSAQDAGADTIMDLSVGENLDNIRRSLISECKVPFGTVPIYQIASSVKNIGDISLSLILEIIEKQAQDGVDFMTVHCGIKEEFIKDIEKRTMPVVSRGGSIIYRWMRKNKKENPFYENFDEIIKIAKKYGIILSLGDALRPGCLADSTDCAQIKELITLGELRDVTHSYGVQVIIEGPGHLPLNHITANVRLAKKITRNAPLYLLGPVVCDIAPGYDHITSAIGASLAAWAGADFICYVTPSEHLSLPTPEEIKEGVISARIAGISADIALGKENIILKNKKMAEARNALDWKTQEILSIDPEKLKKYCLKNKDSCTMCGDFCVFKVEKI